MIITEFLRTREDGVDLYQRTSTLGFKLRQVETGAIYDDPIDIDPCPYTYEETDKPIDGGTTDTETQQKADAFDHLTGGDCNE